MTGTNPRVAPGLVRDHAPKLAGLTAISTAHDKTPAQVMLRWHIQQDRNAIPKSVRPQRVTENFDVFDFQLTPAELEALDNLDTGTRGGPDPADIALETSGRDIPEA